MYGWSENDACQFLRRFFDSAAMNAMLGSGEVSTCGSDVELKSLPLVPVMKRRPDPFVIEIKVSPLRWPGPGSPRAPLRGCPKVELQRQDLRWVSPDGGRRAGGCVRCRR